MAMDQAFVDRMIQNQHSAIRSYWLFTSVLVAAGVVLLVFGRMFAPEAAKIAFQTGGALVASLGTVPIKEVIARKEKLGIFETIKARLQTCHSSQDDVDEPERKRMDDLLWQVIEKTALA